MGYSNGRSKNDKNWENWERIREQKLEKMKNICFESYRQSKRDRLAKPKPKQLDPTWYTDNIYSNRSEDLEEEYIPECLKYGMYRKLRNIREQDEIFIDAGGRSSGGDGAAASLIVDDEFDVIDDDEHLTVTMDSRGEGEGSPSGYGLQRSTSCREFQYRKSQSTFFEDNVYEAGGSRPSGKVHVGPTPGLTSILKNRTNVPKSHSFSVATTTKTTPFDVMDYELPPLSNVRREKQEAFRKSMGGGHYWSNSLDETALRHSRENLVGAPLCCAREHCTSAQCLLDDIYPSYAAQPAAHYCRHSTSGSGIYGAGVSGGSNRNLYSASSAASVSPGDWLDALDHRRRFESGHRMATTSGSRYSLHQQARGRECEQLQAPPPPHTMTMTVCCCAADDYCYHRQQQHHMATSRPSSRMRMHCPGHHPAAEEEEHAHCRAMSYDADLEHFIRDERERLMLQDKFLDDDERYLTARRSSTSQYYRRPMYNNRSYHNLTAVPTSRFDDETCSDTTEFDLEDFNIDLEKYWAELEKPPSPIDLDMQRRNMQSNLKVKNVNVGCYNNGQPIDMHDREQERLMIKKSLLEGMPSPPQIDSQPTPSQATQPTNIVSNPINNANIVNADAPFHFFDHASSPLHRAFNYGHKIYPTADTLPSYKYNNFYPEHNMNVANAVQTQQPTSTGHHTAVGGHSALSLINNIFSIYKPNKYSPVNCHQMNMASKPEPCKKMNVPSTRRPLGAPHSEYMHSMKRPLIVSTEQPHFKIIPEKTGLKISPLYDYNVYDCEKPQTRHKLTSTARPLMLPR